jgi:NOL1/NOP2/sun family putative RNA methylase
LDACASPGSKTTQIASRINNKGLIVANEIKSSRVGRLLENINRAGVKNSIVINSDIERLDFFDNYFDKALIDAPCSGEGMFKKDLDSLKIWTPNLVRMLAGIQRKILSSVSNLVKTGGTIVYSTCTMSIEENEENIDWFIKNFPFELQDIKYGKPGFISYKDKHFDENITKTKRIFPFFEKGEPFFVAKLIKKDRGRTEKKYISKSKMSLKSDIKLDKIVNELKNIGIQIEKSIKIKNINNNIYDISNIDVTAIEMIGERVKISQMGTKIGVLKNNRIEPDYSLAMSISKEEIDKYPNIELDEEKVIKYLRGQEFEIKIPKGYYIATYKKYPLGWLKYSDKLKNLFPSYIRGKI